MRTLILMSFLMTAAAWAHVPAGRYTGQDKAGQSCSFTVGEQWFVDQKPHPLNERIPVLNIELPGSPALTGITWDVFHPPVVNSERGQVRFNHDLFHGVAATEFGAVSVVLVKGATEEAPPQKLIYIEDNYRDSKKSIQTECTGLILEQRAR